VRFAARDAWMAAMLAGCVTARCAPVDFGRVPLHESKSAPVTLSINRPVRVSEISVRTLGKENADFLIAGKSTCRLKAQYFPEATCTVVVSFRPRAAGVRLGAVILTDAAGAPVATAYLHGIGVDRKPRTPLKEKTVIEGLSHPNGVAVDEHGSLFVVTTKQGTGFHNGSIFEELPLPSGDFASIPRVIGIYGQRVIAIDGNHNLFVAGTGMYVYKETPSRYGNYVESSIGGPMGAQCGIAVDGAGNVYVSDCNDNVLYKETLQTNGRYSQTVITRRIHGPMGVAVNGDGAVFVGSQDDKKIYQETPSGAGYRESTIEGPFVAPQGLAFDSDGNLYVADFAAATIERETPTADGYAHTTILTETNSGYLAIDAAGTLYVSDPGAGTITGVPLAGLPDAEKALPQTEAPEN
jgi:sugar lactone lactonase YvrE